MAAAHIIEMVLMSGGDDFDLPEIGSRRRRSGRTYEWKLIKAGEGWDSPDNKDKFEGMLIRSISNAIKPVSTTCWGCTFGINSLTPAAHTPAAGSRELKRVYDQQRRARTNPGSPLDKPATRCSRKITQMSLSPPSALCGDSDLNGVCTHTELNMSLPWQRKRQYSSSSSGFVIERRF